MDSLRKNARIKFTVGRKVETVEVMVVRFGDGHYITMAHRVSSKPISRKKTNGSTKNKARK